jgi:hypothetical protein
VDHVVLENKQEVMVDPLMFHTMAAYWQLLGAVKADPVVTGEQQAAWVLHSMVVLVERRTITVEPVVVVRQDLAAMAEMVVKIVGKLAVQVVNRLENLLVQVAKDGRPAMITTTYFTNLMGVITAVAAAVAFATMAVTGVKVAMVPQVV